GTGSSPPIQPAVDTTPPVITLTGDNPQIIAVGEAYVELGAAATDNHDGDLSASIVIDAGAVDSSVPGEYLVTYDVSDSSGNAAITGIRTVIYEDRTPPQITLVGDNPQTITQGGPYVELGASATDNVDGDLTGAIVIDDSAVDTSTIGSYDVTYDVQDSSGNSATTMIRSVDVKAPPAATTWYRDFDQDGYSNGAMQVAAERPPNYYEEFELTAIFGDCDDEDVTLNPGEDDIDADGIDQDCNGIEIAGPEEVVFDWTTDRCSDVDLPDFPARAFRVSSNQVKLIASHYVARMFVGPDLNTVSRDCNIVMTSDRDPDPSMFNDAEWIGATYTEDGSTVYAVLHNEFEAWRHPGYCTTNGIWTDRCWYNGLTAAVSTDSGESFSHPVAPPLHLVASSPHIYENDQGPRGIFHPSSIVRATDGYYYMFGHRVEKIPPTDYEQYACLIRTSDLSDPDAWRFWDGSSFSGQYVNPYTDFVADPSLHDCAPVDRNAISDMTQSLTWNEFLGRYVLVGTSELHNIFGFYVSYSDDLIDWTLRSLIVERYLPWSAPDPSTPHFLYPSLLDPASTSMSFDTVGETGYIYYTRNNRRPVAGDLDRDLLRVPVRFFRH
ncbi:MAG: hypothetical protein AMS22_16965, partial [Thiotrichales bacterium SG8_50]